MKMRLMFLIGIGSLAALATGAAPAVAAGPCGASGVFSQSGATATCSYTSAGTEDTFTVPANVSSLSVTAVGAPGGGVVGGFGGLGAQVTNTGLPVTQSAGLWVDVGGDGTNAACGSPVGGQFDGAAAGPCGSGGGGGGSSALLTVKRATAVANSQLTGNPATDARLLVAGGGGGIGSLYAAGNAGNEAVTGAGAGGCSGNGGPGGVGPTDGTNGGGSGSGGGDTGNATSAGAGASGGGGGGGGWFGGGGGGDSGCSGGGGGGAGSSYGGAGASGGIAITTASSTQPKVLISFLLTGTITVTKKLVSNSLDPAKFNLKIDGTTYASNVGNNGTTGAVIVLQGTHTVSETAGTNANLSNYTTRIACSDGSSGYTTSLSGITVNQLDNITCTITNTRKLFKVG